MAIQFIIPGTFNNPDLPDLGLMGFVDSFDRPDSTSLGRTESPSRPWLTIPDTGVVQGIAGGEAYVARSGTLAPTSAIADARTADGTLTATMGTYVENSYGLTFRAVDAANYWRLITMSVSSLSLVKVENSTATTVQAINAGSRNPGDVIAVRLEGDSIRSYFNGSEVIAVTDSTHRDATLHGWYNNGPSTQTIRDIAFEPLA